MDCSGDWQELINSITDPIMIIVHGCRISMVNDALLEMQEDTRENVVGKSCYEILHHQDLPCELPDGECPYIEVIESGRYIKVIHHHYSRQKKETIVELTASPLRDKSGRITGMIEVMHDVTLERTLKDESRQSLDFLESVLEGIGEGVVVLDRDYRILTANKGYLQQVDRTRVNVLGKFCYEVSHHFGSHCFNNGHECPVKTVFETGATARVMHTHFAHHRERVYVECHAYPIKDAAGVVVRAIETLNNVTDRVLLERKVKESEGKYHDLYDNAPDGYYSIDENGMIVEVNRTFLSMLGYRREELVAKKGLDSLFSPDSIHVCQRLFPEFKKTGHMKNQELTMMRKDGSILPVLLTATAVYDADGRFVMSRSVVRDITEKRRVDEEKRKLQEQLFQSQKLEALGTLAGGIAHDFNNLLASIMGYASLAKADLAGDDPIHRYVDIIEAASLRASELTQQLLAFAKGGKYDAKPNDVHAIVLEVVALLSRTMDKGIVIDVKTENNLRPAVCDAGQIQQAVLNICINGRDAMPHGGTLAIATENVHLDISDVQMYVDIPPGDYVRISISDTGIGMDRETREHMFEPFFTSKEKGTGLGLSLVYGIVRKHNGFIQVYSEPGKGSAFRVNLPACTGDDTCLKEGEGMVLRKGTETVLVVDDEDLVKYLARDILRRFGYTVLTAGGGEEALALYRRHSEDIAVVILDIIMPNMNGREVFQRIRELNPGAKVIISSGYSHDRDADDLLQQGAAGFVQKPYRMADLVNIVGEVIEKQA